MRLLCVITARAGSKRVPGKNIRILGDKPLVMWSIDVAKNIDSICDVLVSTDDPMVAEVSKEAGVLVPWLRPSSISGDKASSVDAVLHALNWYEEERGLVDGVMLLQPTSPFRTKKTILEGINLFAMHNYRSIIGVSMTSENPAWMLIKKGDFIVPLMDHNCFGARSQDLPNIYIVNGAFYLISPSDLRKHRAFLLKETIPIIFKSEEESVDIDTEHDWSIAEMIAQRILGL